MPTIVDSLIVELKLDPKGFTAGQKQATEALRDLERQAARSSAGVSRSGEGAVSFFRQINNPVAALRRQMELLAVSTIAPRRGLTDLAAQGRRTGTAVEAGAAAGALSLRTLGIAGVAAFGVFEGLKKTIDGATQSARTVFGTTVSAGAAGTGIQRFSAISQALRVTGNVPEQQTQAWLEDWRQKQLMQPQMINAWLNSIPRATTTLGLNPLQDTGEQTLIKFARIAKQLPEDLAIAIGQDIGLTKEASRALRINGTDLQHNIDLENQKHAVTVRNSAAADELLKAESRFGVAWEKITRTFYDQVDPILTAILDRFTKFIDIGEGKIPTAAEVVGGGLAGAATGAIAGSIIPGVGTAAGAAVGGVIGAVGGAYASGYGRTASSSGGSSGGVRVSGRLSYAQLLDYARKAGFPEDKARQIAAIAMAESTGDPNAFNPNDPHGGSFGVTQINGVHPGAKSAMGDPQRAMELAYKISKGGSDFSPWSTYNSGAYKQHLDMSSSGQLPGWGLMDKVKGMIVHHTGGGKTVDDVLNVFKQRGVASNFVIDPQGRIYQTLPEGAAGRHIIPGYGALGAGLNNRNMEGVELIAADNAHVTNAEIQSALKLIKARSKKFGYDPLTSVFGHGEVNPGHRQASEGMAVVDLIRQSNALIAKQQQQVTNNRSVTTGDINIHTPTTDPTAHGEAAVNSIKRIAGMADSGLQN